MGCAQCRGRPANGTRIIVFQKYFYGVYKILAKSNCDHRGCFCFQADNHLFSSNDIIPDLGTVELADIPGVKKTCRSWRGK
uniref:Dynamin_M domain-containing protein n=1 Tax=Strongyloides venezuelensis TaxID=75913 RepID=A0A0K0F1A3_STRVS